jgi:hypothetical protein
MYQDKYTPEEALEKIKLHMKYDVSKTLNENSQILKEDTWNYWNEIAKSFMDDPNQKSLSQIKVGNPTIDVKVASTNIKNIIDGVNFNKSKEKNDLKYVLDKSFTSLDNIIGLIKTYPSIGGESIYDALNGEFFIKDIVNSNIEIFATKLKEWCTAHNSSNINFCKEKTEQELKFKM